MRKETTYWLSKVSIQDKTFTRGVLHEETPLPRRREERGKNEESNEVVGMFIFRKDKRGVSEIALRFPHIFRRGVSLPCGQVQSSSRRPLVRNDMINFVLFFVINEVRRGSCEGGTMCFGLLIRR